MVLPPPPSWPAPAPAAAAGRDGGGGGWGRPGCAGSGGGGGPRRRVSGGGPGRESGPAARLLRGAERSAALGRCGIPLRVRAARRGRSAVAGVGGVPGRGRRWRGRARTLRRRGRGPGGMGAGGERFQPPSRPRAAHVGFGVLYPTPKCASLRLSRVRESGRRRSRRSRGPGAVTWRASARVLRCRARTGFRAVQLQTPRGDLESPQPRGAGKGADRGRGIGRGPALLPPSLPPPSRALTLLPIHPSPQSRKTLEPESSLGGSVSLCDPPSSALPHAVSIRLICNIWKYTRCKTCNILERWVETLQCCLSKAVVLFVFVYVLSATIKRLRNYLTSSWGRNS